MITDFVEQGKLHLAIPVGPVGRGGSTARITSLKGSAGWLAREGRVREWRFQGVTEQGGQLLLVGPHEPGRPLESILAHPLGEALPHLVQLADALLLLKDAGVPAFPLQTDAILLADGGGVLFLPPEVLREIRGLCPFEKNKDSFEAVNHPDLKAGGSACFSIAALLYRLIVGRFPFSGSSEEEIHEQARGLQVPAPGLEVPELLPEISSLVMAGLGRGKGAPPSLEQWRESLAGWQGRDPYRAVSVEEREKVTRERSTVREGSERRFRQRTFWRKRGKLVAVVAAAVILVGAGLGSILSNILAPRPTKGYSPQKVVESFYGGMNSLDQAIMEACVVNRAGRQVLSEVTNLYVITRVTTAYEGKANIVPADTWDRDGRPELGPLVSVYGVTDLIITQEQAGPAPVFLVGYEKWVPVSAPDDGGSMTEPPLGPRFAGTRMSDRVFMRQDKGDWVIHRIDTLSSSAID